VVLAHCASLLDIQQLELFTEGVRQRILAADTLFIDISSCLANYEDAPSAERELIVWRLKKFGLDRVLFGSDYLLIDPTAITPREALRVLTAYPFSQDELDQILNNDGSSWLVGN
jgi:predicted TIM-barrel fold metal-dependent hydrolase